MYRKKPWGSEVVAEETEGYTLKVITVNARSRTSLQVHKKKHETYYFMTVGPDATVEIGDGDPFRPRPDSFLVIPPGTVHRVKGYMQYVEVSTEEDPDDIERIEDDYGRAVPST